MRFNRTRIKRSRKRKQKRKKERGKVAGTCRCDSNRTEFSSVIARYGGTAGEQLYNEGYITARALPKSL